MRLSRPLRYAAAAALVALAAPGFAWASGTPTTSQIGAAQSTAATRDAQVAQVRKHIAVATARLAALDTRAEIATEAFDGAQVRLAKATASANAAEAAYLAAQRQVIDVFASQTYEQGGPLANAAAILSAQGPQQLADQIGTQAVVADEHNGALAQLTAADRRAAIERAAAQRALAGEQAAAAQASAARAAALGAVAHAQATVAALNADQRHLTSLLLAAESTVQRLRAERAAALAAAQRQRAASGSGGSTAHGGGSQGSSLPLPPQPWPYGSPSDVASAQQGLVAVAAAEHELGVPYAWGGGDAYGPTNGISYGAGTVGFDCSGLALFAWAHAGITIDHYTGLQWVEGVRIPVSQIRPGDLVFFATNTADPATIHHVGIYVGNGMMINAPETGEVVSYAPAFGAGFIGAVRP